jgi:membrane fusion protein (multidrug efflux system)
MNLTARRTLLMLGAVIVVVGGLAAYEIQSIRALKKRMEAMRPAPPTVSTTIARATPWGSEIRTVGSLAAVQGVTVSSELAGTVARIAFESGARVEKGDLLVQLDISTDEAQLRGAEAQARLAAITLQRARQLRKSDSNSQADLDTAQAQADQAAAAADNLRAVIAKKTLRAPFAGIAGIRIVNLGQFIAPGGPVVSVQALDPIYADFAVPQQRAGDLAAGQPVRVATDAYPDVVFAGRVNALDPRVDNDTRNIQAQATVPNPDGRLRPGMFARVDVVLPGLRQAITLPQTAVVYNPYGSAVYVIETTPGPSGASVRVARQHFVTLGETRGDEVAVLKGVEPGDEVVTSGQIKLRNGSPVQVSNTAVPPVNPAPTPPNT